MILAELFIPHGHCYLWKPELVGLHIVSDALTALAYYSIPLMLIYFVAKRQDVPFNWIFLLFGGFIVSCGTGHLMSIWTLWHPNYWLSGFLKACTAVVSVYTAYELIWLLPQALAMPSAAQFEAVKTEIKERQRAEAALLREKTHLALAQKIAHVGSWELDLTTEQVTWSDEIFRIYGLQPKQPIPAFFEHRQKIHPDDRPIWDTTISQLIKGKPYKLEFRILHADNSIRHILGQAEPMFNTDGQVEKLFGTVLDITERKLAEQAQARLTEILEATPDIIGICDATGRKIYVNPAGRQVQGIEPDGDITNHQISDCHPKEAADFILNQAVPSAIANGVWRGETLWRRWDASVFPVSQVIIAHKSERGEVEYISTIARDISDIKRAEAALQESEKRFRAIFEQVAVGIVKVSLSGEFLQVNQRYCDLMGYTESELLARICQDLIHPDDQELTLDHQRRLLAGEIPTYSLEKRYIRKDNKVQWVNSTVSLVRDSQGAPAYFLKVVVDIGERKRTAAALQRQLAAVEAAKDGIAIVNGEQEYIYLNKAHLELYGYDSSTQLLGKTWRELYYPDEIRRLDQEIFPMLSHQGHWHGEAIGKKRDGSAFVQEISLTLTTDAGLICVCRDITERKQAEMAFQQQVEREQLVGAIALRIRQSLELDEILNTSVTEVRQFLQTDRVLIYRFNPDWSGQVAVESVGADWMAVLGSTFDDPCFGKNYAQLYQQGRVRAIANIHTAGLTPCYVELIAPLQVIGSLTVPIMQGEKLWGLLIAHHCRGEKQWQSYEIELLQQLSTQVAIALQQSELYCRVQAELIERQRIEQELRVSEERYRSVVTAMSEGIVLQEAEGRIIACNASAESILGLSAQQILGLTSIDPCWQTIYEDGSPFPGELHPAMVTLQTGEPQSNVIMGVHKPDGSLTWISVNSQPLFQPGETQAYAVVTSFSDISDRKIAQEALRQQKKLLQTIFDHIPVMICLFDAKGEILLLNREFERLLGWSLPEARDVDLMSECYPDPEYRAKVWDFMQQATGKWQDFKVRTRYGSDVDSCWANIRLSDGTAIGIGSDIRERKRAEEALRMLTQQEREKATQLEQALKELTRTQAQLVQNEKMVSLGQLVAGIAHEINNPTSFIYGNITPATDYSQCLLQLLQLYAKHYPEPVAEIAEYIEFIELDFIAEDFPKLLASMKEGAHRIGEIVQSLRNFSRLDEMECKSVNIHEGIDNTLLILQHRLAKQSKRPAIRVIKEYGELPLVECYPGQLNQVFMNILSNAIEALEELKVSKLNVESWKDNLQPSHVQPSTPCIRIHTEIIEENWLIIRIADNGPGIKAEVQQRIFDPFFTTKSPGKGTGLGLSISYQIVVEKHRGQLSCHSVPGQGTEFVIQLPIARSTLTHALRQSVLPEAIAQDKTAITNSFNACYQSGDDGILPVQSVTRSI